MADINDPEYRAMMNLSMDRAEKILELQTENERLKEFSRRVIKQECWGYGDLDGGSVQDWAEKLGLIKKGIATKEDVGDPEFSYFEEGDTFYRFTEILKG